jgi:hypothetical protein
MDQAITIARWCSAATPTFQAGAGIVADSIPKMEYQVRPRAPFCASTLNGAGGAISYEHPPMKTRLLLIDNYDSFTYNLQAFLVLGAEVLVHRNTITIRQAEAPARICISPGPGTPHDAGVSMKMIEHFAGKLPIFGVCLGHQSLVEVFGGKVVRARRCTNFVATARAFLPVCPIPLKRVISLLIAAPEACRILKSRHARRRARLGVRHKVRHERRTVPSGVFSHRKARC